MSRHAAVTRSAALVAIGVAVPVTVIALFLGDQLTLDWQDWAIAGAIVTAAAGAIVTFRRDSLARALVWFVSLAIVALLLFYDVLDAIVDPFMEADWPVVIVAVVVVVGLGSLLGILISDDE